MSLITLSVGYVLGRSGFAFDKPLYLATLIGMSFVAAGSAALNHILEIKIDSKMERTKDRPLPSKKLSLTTALILTLLSFIIGFGIIVYYSTPLVLILAISLVVLYDFIYTPLKRITTLNTYVGGIPGALPPLCGWAAAQNSLPLDAWILFAIFFFWQLPHFFAIAYMYRVDYANAGLKMAAEKDDDGRVTSQLMIVFMACLFGASLLPLYTQLLGWIYAIGMLSATIIYVRPIITFTNVKNHQNAKKVLLASIIYQPILIIFMVLDYLI